MKPIINIILFAVLVLKLLSACEKKQPKKLTEKFYCSVHHYSWTGGLQYDTTYNETIEVKREGDYITLLGNQFLVNSVWRGNLYSEGYVHDHREIQFKSDSIYFSTYSGGLGGGDGTNYTGIKID